MTKRYTLAKPLAISLVCLFISACGTKYVTQPPTVEAPPPLLDNTKQPLPAEERPAILPTATLPPPLPAPSLPAANSLRGQATVASQANDHARAIGLLERALRISPNDPQIFHDLASNHLALNQPQQAIQLARRGLSINPTSRQRDALEQLITRSQASL